MKKVAVAGAGSRGLSFARPLAEGAYPGVRLVAVQDVNPLRMQGFCDVLGGSSPPPAQYRDLGELLERQRPDLLIVCTPDHTHPEVIEQALAAGVAVVTEKPMAIDRVGLGRILRAERAAAQPLCVAFNMRYMPFAQRVKQLLLEGVIGAVRSISADWFVDRTHGLEYFRRWHAHLEQSGGLLVHKSTHHFDLLNWWTGRQPERVSALGSLEVFGAANSPFPELTRDANFRGRCRECLKRSNCWASMPLESINDSQPDPDPSSVSLKKLYFDAEQHDGYVRDRCVFRDSIDIYDTMSVLIGYRGGVQATYSLTAYAPYQGYAVTINGSAGRLEAKSISTATRSPEMGDRETIRSITGQTRRDVAMRVEDMPIDRTPHAGSDGRMMDRLFRSHDSNVVYGDAIGAEAGSAEGAASALIGICANESIRDGGRMVRIPSLEALLREGRCDPSVPRRPPVQVAAAPRRSAAPTPLAPKV